MNEIARGMILTGQMTGVIMFKMIYHIVLWLSV